MRTPRQTAKAAFILRELAASHHADADQLRKADADAALHQHGEGERFDQFAEPRNWVLGRDTSEGSIFRRLLGELGDEQETDWPEPSGN